MPTSSPPVAVFDDTWSPTLTFTYSLGRRGVPLHFYGSGSGQWTRFRHTRAACPPPGLPDEFLPWLQEKIAAGTIARIAPTSDLIAYYISALRDHFPRDVARAIAPLSEIEACLIKSRFADRCLSVGCETPAVASPTGLDEALEAAERLGYPVILKPKSHLGLGFAERGSIAHSADELRQQFRPYSVQSGQNYFLSRYPELPWPLLQKYLPAAQRRVYSVSGVRDRDTGIVSAAVSFKGEQWPPGVGTSIRQVGVNDPRILTAGLGVVEHFLSSGIFELELVEDADGGLNAIDLNPRGFGFMGLDLARGQDLPWLWYSSTLHPVTPLDQSTLIDAVEAVPPAIGLWVLLANSIAGPSKKRAIVSMLGHGADPAPLVRSNLAHLKHPRSLLRAQWHAYRTHRDRLAPAAP